MNKTIVQLLETTTPISSTYIPVQDSVSEITYKISAPNLLASKASINSPEFTGVPTAPTQLVTDNSEKLATTAFVKNVASSKANIDSPQFTNGIVVSCPSGDCFQTDGDEGDLILNNETGKAYSNSFLPLSDNSARIATTAFVKAVAGGTANLNGTNYLMVYGTGTPEENGAELQAAYEEAKKMPRYVGVINYNVTATIYAGQTYTIGGPDVTLLAKKDYTGLIQNMPVEDSENITAEEAKSVRTTLIVAPGQYLIIGRFGLDIMNIDVVSLTGNPDVEIPHTYISSSTTIRGIVSNFTLNHTMSYQPPTIIDCVGGFYAEYNNYATYIRCTGTTTSSFISDFGFTGVARDCRMLVGNFPTPTGEGKIYNCINGDGSIYNNVKVAIANGVAAGDAVNKGQLDLKSDKFELKSNNLTGITDGESLNILYHIYKFTTNTDFDLLLSGCAVGSTVILKLIGNITVNIFSGGGATLDGQNIDISTDGTNYTITGSYNKITIYKDSLSSWITI